MTDQEIAALGGAFIDNRMVTVHGRAVDLAVRVAGRDYRLVVAINEATAEVKYFVSNATDQPLRLVLLAAFRRATIEHGFRVGKQEAGLMHYEGRHYVGLMRHLILSLIVLGFVSLHTERLRGENPQVTREQVCRALNQRCGMLLRRRRRTADGIHVGLVIRYHQHRNEQAARSHQKRRHRCNI